MGNEPNLLSPRQKVKVNKNNFTFQYVIGKGGFGKVWKAIFHKTKIIYALKEMSKVKIMDKKCEENIIFERELLSRLKNNFIANMHYAFQDYDSLYLVMDYLSGGDLRYHISKKTVFTEEQIKFFFACIIEALGYIHKNNIIHRDLKPENLVLNNKGYLKLTDFGIANTNKHLSSKQVTSGTPGYLSPEVLFKQTQSFASDFYALGVIGYEFMLRKRPYQGENGNEIKQEMLTKKVIIKQIPDNWSKNSVDFINQLLARKPVNRLGTKGIQELIEHPWFDNFNWEALRKQTIIAPFIPEQKDNFNIPNCANIEDDKETLEKYQHYRDNENYVSAFLGFTFNNAVLAFNKIGFPSINSSTIRSNKNEGITRNKKTRWTITTSLNELTNKTKSFQTLDETEHNPIKTTSLVKRFFKNKQMNHHPKLILNRGLISRNTLQSFQTNIPRNKSISICIKLPKLDIRKSIDFQTKIRKSTSNCHYDLTKRGSV